MSGPRRAHMVATGADLTGADLTGADLTGADLKLVEADELAQPGRCAAPISPAPT